MTQDELTEIFRRLGVSNPASWASSQINEGIPQLGRFLVIRAMWDCVTRAGTTNWIDYELKHSADTPHAKALQQMLDAGVSREAMTELVRFKQAESLREVCYLLEDYTSVPQNSNPDTGEEYVRWSLRQLDTEDQPMAWPIDGLHESFWSLDPALPENQQS
ncbi:hypothetical protein FEM03_09990 [Phragmitibacter flavus]|uniref:Uncharacterized protein n=1 Tax=Phragmitibacter flavus TaxID=2576071 RepID=A0A5R8KED7_9BACT|nr:hypothetical protein [Phragmitibacter flavus]TLD70640.1 hypothetical protein FEM03_09990 [Phragmitibacter flavus]